MESIAAAATELENMQQVFDETMKEALASAAVSGTDFGEYH